MTGPTARTMDQNAGLLLGIAMLATALMTEPPAGLSPAVWQVAGVMTLVALLWATEALPFAATALVPLALLPSLGAATAESLTRGYVNTAVADPRRLAACARWSAAICTCRMTLRDIMRAGWRVNLAAIVIVNAVSTLVLPRLVWAARPARRI